MSGSSSIGRGGGHIGLGPAHHAAAATTTMRRRRRGALTPRASVGRASSPSTASGRRRPSTNGRRVPTRSAPPGSPASVLTASRCSCYDAGASSSSSAPSASSSRCPARAWRSTRPPPPLCRIPRALGLAQRTLSPIRLSPASSS
jgi:hypothetical protein